MHLSLFEIHRIIFDLKIIPVIDINGATFLVNISHVKRKISTLIANFV